MTNPDELQRRFSGPSRTFWITLIGVLAAVLAIVALTARPAWRAVKRWRAEQFRQKAEQAFAAGRWRAAMDEARSAIQLDPLNPKTQRLNARILTKVGSETSLAVWQRVIASPSGTEEDQIAYAEAALAFERSDLVAPIVSNLLASNLASARLHRVGALFHVAGRRFDRAMEQVREAIRLEPGNPTNTAMLGTLLAVSPSTDHRNEARKLFEQLALTNGPFQLQAQQRLVQTDLGERLERERIVEHLSGLPQRNITQEVLLAETRMTLDPAITSATLSNLVANLRHDDLEQLTLVVDALMRHQRYQEVVQLTLAGRSLLNRSLLVARHDALLALGRAEEAYRLLLGPGVPLPPWDLALARVRAARNSKDHSRLEAHLQELLQEAKGSAKRIREAAELSEEAGVIEVAKAAWTQLLTDPTEAPLALRRLQRLADLRGDTWTARDYARRALRLDPSLTSLAVELAYYDLLLGEDLDRALATAEAAFRAQPDDFFTRATVALGYLRLGRPERARTLLDRVVVDEPTLRADALAVVAATYGQNDLVSRAEEIASRIPLNRLRPEERDLIRPWLSRPSTPP